MILTLSVVNRSKFYGKGYIAGQADGVVTVAGKVASRTIYLYAVFNHKPMVLIAQVWSTNKGNYIFPNLDTKQRYLIMVRDYEGMYEPFAYDQVEPATDLTLHEQYQLQQSWQIK